MPVADLSSARRLDVVTDDGVRLVAEVRGSGPGLLLVHGFGGLKEDFADHAGAFAETHTVVTFDHRGHGERDKPEALDAYSLDRLRADVLAVADAAELDTFVLLGHSMGGMVVRRIATDHPHRVRALVMMDTSPGPIPSMDPAILDLGAEIAINDGKDALKAALDAAAPLDSEAYQRVLVERPGYQEYVDHKWNTLSVVMWAALARAIGYQSDDLELFASLSMPLLVIVGEQDESFIAPSEAMHATAPDARLVVIPGAGHSPQFENPAAWYAALSEFVAAVA